MIADVSLLVLHEQPPYRYVSAPLIEYQLLLRMVLWFHLSVFVWLGLVSMMMKKKKKMIMMVKTKMMKERKQHALLADDDKLVT